MTRKPFVLLTFVIGLLAAFSYFVTRENPAQAQTSETFGGNIVLGRPTDRSITVNVLFTANQDEVYLEYGVASGASTNQTPTKRSIQANVPYEEVISGLEPNRRNYYCVRYKAPNQTTFGASAEHSFHTQRAKDSTFTFSLISDSHLFTTQHCDPARYALALANARDDNPDFHIDLGDTFRTDTITNNPNDTTYQLVLNRQIAHRPYFNILTHSAPLFLVNGNHDSEYLYYTKPESNETPNLPLWSTNARLALFPNPRPDSFYSGDQTVYPGVDGGLREAFYAWEWGDALFVALDPFWKTNRTGQSDNWAWTLGDAQYQWLKRTLETSQARYRFVFLHHLVGGADTSQRGGVEAAKFYEWGGFNTNNVNEFAAKRPGWEMPIHQLLVKHKVSAVFHGHDHLYVKQDLDGIVYQEVPQPGHPRYDSPRNAAEYGYTSGEIQGSAGHLRITIRKENAQVDYVRSDLSQDERGGRKNGTSSYSYAIATASK